MDSTGETVCLLFDKSANDILKISVAELLGDNISEVITISYFDPNPKNS